METEFLVDADVPETAYGIEQSLRTSKEEPHIFSPKSEAYEGIEIQLVQSALVNENEKRNRKSSLLRKLLKRNKVPATQRSMLIQSTIVLRDSSGQEKIHISTDSKSESISECIKRIASSRQQVINNTWSLHVQDTVRDAKEKSALLQIDSSNEDITQTLTVKAKSFLELHDVLDEESQKMKPRDTTKREGSSIPECFESRMFGIFDSICDGEHLMQAQEDIISLRSPQDDDERLFDSPYAYTFGTLTDGATLSSLDDSGSLCIFTDDDTYTSNSLLQTFTNYDSRVGMRLDSGNLCEPYDLNNGRDTREQKMLIDSSPADWSCDKFRANSSHDYSGSTITSIDPHEDRMLGSIDLKNKQH